MSERGLIFTDDSVRAILAGRKTQTRRVVKPTMDWMAEERLPITGEAVTGDLIARTIPCPHGIVGDRVWVREAWRAVERESDMVDGVLYRADNAFGRIENSMAAAEQWGEAYANGKYGDRWRSPLFMPRWASRIMLEITSVRVERLQAITCTDALAEGWVGPTRSWEYRRRNERGDSFPDLWDAINAKRGIGWDQNPWVWVLEFRRIDEHGVLQRD